MRMKTSDLSGFFLRSLFIMASLNFRRMQNLGFTYAISPLSGLRKESRENCVAFLLRHLEYFNTHPYLSGAVLGSTIRLEEEDTAAAAREAAVAKLKKSLMGPYAALGDSFFWGSLRPLAGVTAAILAYEGCIWAPFAFLLLFNPLHLWIRWKGFLEGYRQGWQGIVYIQSWDLPRRARYLRRGSLVILGLATVLLAEEIQTLSLDTLWLREGATIVVPAAVLISYYAVSRGLSPLLILYAMTAVCMVMTS